MTIEREKMNCCLKCMFFCLQIFSVLVLHRSIAGAPQKGSSRNCSKTEGCLFLEQMILCDAFCVASVAANFKIASSRLFQMRKAGKNHSGLKIGCYVKAVEGKNDTISSSSGLSFCMRLCFEICCS